jgi:glutamine synthetase
MPKNPAEVLQLAKQAGVKIVDLKFVDLPGVWQHFSLPVEDLNEDLFEEGIGFDGSSIRGARACSRTSPLRCWNGSPRLPVRCCRRESRSSARVYIGAIVTAHNRLDRRNLWS